MPRGMIETLWTRSVPGSDAATSACPISWGATICRSGESGRESGDLLEIQPRCELDPLDVDLEDGDASGLVGAVDQHLAVEAPGAQQRRVEHLGAVGRAEQ